MDHYVWPIRIILRPGTDHRGHKKPHPRRTSEYSRRRPKPNYNVAPTHVVPIVRTFKDVPTIGPATWGYPPKTVFNARGETAYDKPLFAGSLPCAFPMDGWYEWTKDGTRKQPWFTANEDGSPLFMAGLCTAIDGVLYGTIITTEALPDLQWLHHRMPRILVGDEMDFWLSDAPDAERKGFVAASNMEATRTLTSRKVSTAVGNVANNSPALLE